MFPVHPQVAPETHHTNLPRSSESAAEGHSGSSNHCKEQEESAGIVSTSTLICKIGCELDFGKAPVLLLSRADDDDGALHRDPDGYGDRGRQPDQHH